MSELVDSNGAQDASMEKTTDQATTNGQPDAPAVTPVPEAMPSVSAPSEAAQDEDMIDAPAEPDGDGDSEAETLIQSPEKQRLANDNASVSGSASATRPKDEDSTTGATAAETDSNSRKRKRSIDDVQDDPAFSTSSRRSSPLSSPRIPPHSPRSDSEISNHIASQNPKPARRKRDTNDTSDSGDPEEKSVRTQTRKRRPSDILPPISKHRTKNSSGGVDPGSSDRRETRSATYPRHSSQDRSPSPRPQRKEHRRGVSTQLTLGDVERKKRGRPPAIQTRRSGSADNNRAGSSSSEDSDSPEQQRPSLHKFSSADHDTMSPAKVTGPRKWRDKNGRTFLSRAASNNDLAASRIKFAERPEDLNQPDNAGNTPLQIAALQGYVNIVRFLVENKCDIDTRNIDKDTALIDAVENGHVEVVRLLLNFGANPRLGNAKGDEPYELVPQDDENYEEIRQLLAEAKDRPNRRISSDHNDAARDGASSRAASAASPRDSPPMMGPRSPPAGFGRRRTGRSESTRNDLLWQANTQENLKKLASQGDVQGVANILNVLQKAETDSLIAAAKAGHEEVLQYLLAMGNTEPDPDPIRHLKLGYNTPLLAAIGRGHPEVVQLLVEQSGFNPSRKLLKGKTYFEVSAERRGEQWQKEYDILKSAYEKYAVKHRKATSPRATRDDKVKSQARAIRRSQSPMTGKLRKSSSPTLTYKQLPGKSPRSLEKEKDRDTASLEGADKRKHQASKRDIADPSVAVSSDQDQPVHAPRKGHVKRRSQSDLPQPSHLDPEGSHRRRRLVTGKEHRRRKSNVDGSTDEEPAAVKMEAKSGTALKRTRASVSPGPMVTEEGENGRSVAKKRRTVIESSPEETRPGLKRSSVEPSSPAREHKAQGEGVSNREKSVSEPIAQEHITEAMELDKPEADKPTEVAEILSPAPVESDIPREHTETTEEIKTEPVETGPSEAELRLQEQEEARKAEEARQLEEQRIAAEKAAEERRQAEEAERLRKAEEEAAMRKKEEEERQERMRREHEERLRRQEEQRKEQQRRQEELFRELQRRERLEAEQRRRDALPALLKHCALLIDNSDPKVRSEEWLKLFLPLYTVKSVQLDPNDADNNDLWIPNFQAAGLLATKDLNLRNYTSFERRQVTLHQRQRLWGVARNSLAYEFQTNQWNTTIKQAIQREQEERPKFYAMEELFWVKVCLCRV